MKRNKNLLVKQLDQKFTAIVTKSLVTEAFINALPFPGEEVEANLESFVEYSNTVLNSLSPESLIARALEAAETNYPDKPEYNDALTDLENSVSSVVRQIATEAANDAYLSDDTTPEIVETAKLDQKATDKLAQLSKQNGIKGISKVIKKTVIDTIKKEKAEYEEEQKMREDIRDMLKSEDNSRQESGNFADTAETAENADAPAPATDAVESYLNYLLAPTDARHPISFFSKLQDVCMEGLMSYPDFHEEFNHKFAAKITLESTFDYFDKSKMPLNEKLEYLAIASEGAAECANMTPEEKAMKMKRIAKTAFICSICIMTMMQTLKTMRLCSPSLGQVKDFVNTPTKNPEIDKVALTELEPEIADTTNGVRKSIAMGAMTLSDAVTAQEALNKIKTQLERIAATESMKYTHEKIMNDLTTALENLSRCIDEGGCVKTPSEPAITSEFVSSQKANNISRMEYVVKRIARDPSVTYCQISVNGQTKIEQADDLIIEIVGYNASDIPVKKEELTLAAAPEFGNNIAEVLKYTANYCDFGTKPVYIYYLDAGYKVNIKG